MPGPCHDGRMDDVELLVATWRAASRVVVLTGAGISTDSGIADFRGPQGLWTRDPTAALLFDIDAYVRDPGVRRRAWAERRANPAWHARPNRGHLALAELQRSGRVGVLLTQNIDGLHQAAGATDVLELHGTMWQVLCMSCDARWPTPEILAREEADPACQRCGGILKTATISFGQALDHEVLGAAVTATQEADLLVAVGTSLQVHPVAGLAELADRLAIVNAEPTPYDRYADVVVRAPISEVLCAVRDRLAGAPAGG